MVVWDTAYSPMDRKYEQALLAPRVRSDEEIKVADAFDGMEISQLSADTAISRDMLSELRAKIFAGVSKVELGFLNQPVQKTWGDSGKSPESYGKEEREAIRDLATINKIQLTTHASPQMGSVAGYGRQGFEDEARHKAVIELRRNIEFAADVAKGGTVVLHVGEWQRPIYAADKGIFEAFPDEAKKGNVILADKDTGNVQSFAWDTKFPDPVIASYDKDKKPIYEVDEKSGVIKTIMKTARDMVEEERRRNPDAKESDEMLFLKHLNERQIEEAEFEVKRYGKDFKEIQEKIQKVDKALSFYEDVENAVKKGKHPEEYEDLKRAFEEREFAGLVPPEIKTPGEFLRDLKERLDYQKQALEEGVKSKSRGLTKLKHEQGNLRPIEEVGLDKTGESLAEAAMYAYRIERTRKLDKPIRLAPELIYPESYGGHPDELKKIVLHSRKMLADKLMRQEHLSEADAQKVAAGKIAATLDTGHIFTWRKYFKGSKEEFDKWVLDKTEDLAKSGVIGHVHVTDNFGYVDEHLAPGQGEVPIKGILGVLRKHKVLDDSTVVVEGQGTVENWLGALNETSNPIYNAGPRWDKAQMYQTLVKRPYYVLQSYAPIQETKPWTETPFD